MLRNSQPGQPNAQHDHAAQIPGSISIMLFTRFERPSNILLCQLLAEILKLRLAQSVDVDIVVDVQVLSQVPQLVARQVNTNIIQHLLYNKIFKSQNKISEIFSNLYVFYTQFASKLGLK